MEKVWKNWKIDCLLGEKKLSKVFRISREDMGCVYSSALKVITISPTEYDRMQALVQVLVLMSGLKDATNILGYDDYEVVPTGDDCGWELFLRMELQMPLSAYTEKRILTEREVVKLGIDICKALEVCEANGIIHRNIKPENIFVSGAGDFLLGDFGISELERAADDLPKDVVSPYMAPEVYKGQAYGNTADVYSLGAVLYRCMNNNRAPFMPLYDDQPKINPPCNADKKLANIILKACSYDPNERYQCACDLRVELEKIFNKNYSEKPKTGILKTALITILIAFTVIVVTECILLMPSRISGNNGNTTQISTSAALSEEEIQKQKETEYKVITDRIKRKYRTESLSGIISCGESGVAALKEDGTVFSYSVNGGYDEVPKWTDITAVSQGSSHIVGLKQDGTVLADGNNDAGQCKVFNWTDISKISAGAFFTVGLKNDGTCVAVGSQSDGQCYVSALDMIVDISAGYNHLSAVKSSGYAVSVGSNHFKEGDVFGWTDISEISSGDGFTIGLKSDGTVVATGANAHGQCDVEEWDNIVSISAGNNFSVGIKADGTVISTKRNTGVEEWQDIAAVSTGSDCIIGVKNDGTVICTGEYFTQDLFSDWKLWE